MPPDTPPRLKHAYPNDAQLPLRRLSLAEAIAALPDHLTEDGQRLRDDAPPKLRQGGPGLWVLTTPSATDADVDAIVETELLLAGRKVKAYTCGCGAFAKTRACAHLAALLALVQLAKLPTAIRRPPRRPKAITTKTLLDIVPDHELRGFLAERARRDSELGLALRVRFAHHSNLVDRFGPVVSRLLQRRGNRYTPTELRRIGDGLDHFARLRAEWRAQGAWLDLLELSTTLLEGLVVVLDRLEDTRLAPREYAAALIGDLLAIAEAPAAPALLRRVRDWLSGQLERGAYFRQELDGALFRLMAALPDGREGVLEALEEALARFGESPSRLRTYRRLLLEAGRTREAEAVLFAHLDSSRLVLDALAEHVANGRLRAAAKLARSALAKCCDAELRVRLLRVLRNIAAADHTVNLSVEGAAELYAADADLDAVLETAATVADRLALTTSLRERAREANLVRQEAELDVVLEDWPALEQLLYRHSEDTQLASDFLPRLAPNIGDEDLGLLLGTAIAQILDGRFGAAPAREVTTLLDAVARRTTGEAVTIAVARLRQAYPERDSLLQAFRDAGF